MQKLSHHDVLYFHVLQIQSDRVSGTAMSVVRANQRCRNLATSLSPESTRSIMIISGEPAATDYHSPAGPGTYGAGFFSFLDSDAAHRRLREQCGQFRRSLLCTQWTRHLDYYKAVYATRV